MPFVLPLLISFCTGIALSGWLPYIPTFYGWIFILMAVLALDLKVLKIESPNWKGFCLLSICILGIFRAQLAEHSPDPQDLDWYHSEESNRIRMIGNIAEEPDIRRDKVNYTLQIESIEVIEHPRISPGTYPIDESYVLISTGKYPRYSYGQAIEASGHLQKPAIFDSFDYAAYLSRYHIYSVMYRPYVRSDDERESIQGLWPWFFGKLLQVKSSFETQMNRSFSTEPSSSFMAGLLLGSRKGIPEALSEDFRITGLTHIIAISGYNITLIVSILMSLFLPLGRNRALFLSALGIILFTLFVGASPAVVRACIMGLIGLFALRAEQKTQVTITLFLTAAIMVGWNPKILLHDVGFQLSFLATMGLIYVAPLIEKYFLWIPQQLALRESILLTISAQIMALPIILMNFQNLSIVSPLSNLLVSGPIIPLAMLFGFIATMTSYLSLTLAKLIAYSAYLLLEYIVQVIQLTAKIPFASVEISWFDETIFLLYSTALVFFLHRRWSEEQKRELQRTDRQNEFQQLISYTAFALQKKGLISPQ